MALTTRELQELLGPERLDAPAERGTEGPPYGEVHLQDASLRGGHCLARATFREGFTAWECRFEDAVDMSSSTFAEDVVLTGSVLADGLTARNTRLGRAGSDVPSWAGFDRLSVRGACTFRGVSFYGEVSFAESDFDSDVVFRGCTFHEAALFCDLDRPQPMAVKASIVFRGCTFRKGAYLEGIVARSILFDTCVFDGDCFLRATGVDALTVSDCKFGGKTLISVDASGGGAAQSAVKFNDNVFTVNARVAFSGVNAAIAGNSFVAGGVITAPSSRIALRSCQFGGPTLLQGERGNPGNLLSLGGTSVHTLRLAHLDLSECEFGGVDGLDQLGISPTCAFAASGSRVVIADEPLARAKTELLVLWLYRATSYYSLRVGQSLLVLALLLASATLVMSEWGWKKVPSPGYVHSLWDVLGGMSIFGGNVAVSGVTTLGHVVGLVMRVAGPIQIGMAALALRSRVRR